MEDATAPRHYNRAPIVEATIGVVVPSSDEDQASALDAARQALGDTYPAIFRPDSTEEVDEDDGVCALKSADEKYVVRFAKDRFVLSRLAPYEHWGAFTEEFRRTWSIFEATVKPAKVEGLSVRYINKLRVPLNRPLREFFNVYPAWPDPSALFNQLFIFVETTVTEPPGRVQVYMLPVIEEADVSGGFIPIVLGNSFHFSVESMDNVWRNMDAIRAAKNALFESQLTDEMKETIA